ncbi:MAG: DUF5116 domain-containing protein [Flavobacterium sp.]|uniref:SusE domain-containing protein n=1 Tax=unclassified Flavobacterium TaxID=196869 RepID=UPI000C694F27|nr:MULTISPECIES: SusE domain-containing protein [unclassified Flavobacterium]MBF03199.1 DUF5116 domain-containing protein [Flavobacterium sp.]MCO6161329.1 SusE domain-containing protein [Flavobacterium sp. NRK F7]
MKKILKISALALLLFTSFSCENDEQVTVKASGDPQLVSPVNGSTYELNPANAASEATTLVWNHAEYSVQTEVNYEVQIALSGTDFATYEIGGMTTSRFVTWTVEALNGVMLNLGAIPYDATDVDVRVKASLGSNESLVTYSNVITLTITPYPTDLPKIAVPGNHQGWNPPTAPELAASDFGKTDFEGFLWLDGEFKFIAPNASGAYEWGNVDWGDDGTFSGVLLQGSSTNCGPAAAGYYRVKANTGAVTSDNPNGLTYSVEIANWAVTGAATPNGWPDPALDHDMTYNASTKKWSITLPLTAGEFKFRANNGWDLNLGGDSNGDEYMDYGGPNLTVPSAGTYLIELDLSNPREYTYSLTAQ